MNLQTNDTTRLSKLSAKLVAARMAAAAASANLKKATRIADKADEVVSGLREEFDQERLRLWGAKPDIAAILEANASMTFYYAGEAMAEALGLGFGMAWSDTGQQVLHLKLNRGELGAVERAKAAVLFFAPYIKPKRGMARFGVRHKSSEDFAVELRYSVKTGGASVVRMTYGIEDQAQKFSTLDAALSHIQEHHWVEEFIEAVTAEAALLTER